jgi:hypothetical protein
LHKETRIQDLSNQINGQNLDLATNLNVLSGANERADRAIRLRDEAVLRIVTLDNANESLRAQLTQGRTQALENFNGEIDDEDVALYLRQHALNRGQEGSTEAVIREDLRNIAALQQANDALRAQVAQLAAPFESEHEEEADDDSKCLTS